MDPKTGTSSFGHPIPYGLGLRAFREVGAKIHLYFERWQVRWHGKLISSLPFLFVPQQLLPDLLTYSHEQTHKKTFVKYMRELEEQEGKE